MTEFEKQAFELIEGRELLCEGLVCDYEDRWKLVRFDLGICPINVEICDAEDAALEEGKDRKVKLLLIPGAERFPELGEIFKDEEEYYRERTMKTMAAESIIPAGTFSPNGDPNFQEDAAVILQAKIKSVRRATLDGEAVLHIVLSMQGDEFDAIFSDGELPYAESGNVISAAFTAVGVIVEP